GRVRRPLDSLCSLQQPSLSDRRAVLPSPRPARRSRLDQRLASPPAAPPLPRPTTDRASASPYRSRDFAATPPLCAHWDQGSTSPPHPLYGRPLRPLPLPGVSSLTRSTNAKYPPPHLGLHGRCRRGRPSPNCLSSTAVSVDRFPATRHRCHCRPPPASIH